ncbi:hypothetical protein PMAYCL1PPCAC_31808 [Pristionchus mayeri]|uniref:Uncharacterized protein n=1 Tax=Pristionchus mayeri TaxID=1317129 RepID=A0AAN5DEC5_9BILA|nr:hypothetical protein PMAYCL1PPCAC_31808 [Pristionchus mayeri]
MMIAFRIAAASLLVAVALSLHHSDSVKVCGSAVGKLFQHPECEIDKCQDNWPPRTQMQRLLVVLCTGDRTLQNLMDLCCVSDAAKMRAIIDEVAAAPAPRVPAARVYAPRVPNVPHIQQKFEDIDDSMFAF